MALRIFLNIFKKADNFNHLKISQNGVPLVLQTRGKRKNPNIRPVIDPHLAERLEDSLTEESKEMINQIAIETLAKPRKNSPLIPSDFKPGTWAPGSIRCGVIGKKIGIYPMWTKKGVRILTTLIQIEDNHVIKYIPPEEYKVEEKLVLEDPTLQGRIGCLIVGAGSRNPQEVTDEYLEQFKEAGVLPKQKLHSFMVTPNAALPPGQALGITHFRCGDYVDCSGFTTDHGFQGVMKRWGFSGMPATHGVTKSHRRMGSLSCGKKRGVWKGKKMPGMMGNYWRTHLGDRIIRINYEHNVLYILGPAIPGPVGNWVMLQDSVVHPFTEDHLPPHFPCHLDFDNWTASQEEEYIDELHKFSDPTLIIYDHDAIAAKKKKKRT